MKQHSSKAFKYRENMLNLIDFDSIPSFTEWGNHRPEENEFYLVYKVSCILDIGGWTWKPHYTIRKYHNRSFGSEDVKYWIKLSEVCEKYKKENRNMKMEWISNAKYSQKAEDGGVFKLRMNGEEIGVIIHHYAGCGNLWFLTCKIIGCDTINLETENFDEAVAKAQKIIDKKLNEIYFRLREFTLNVGENIMVKY